MRKDYPIHIFQNCFKISDIILLMVSLVDHPHLLTTVWLPKLCLVVLLLQPCIFLIFIGTNTEKMNSTNLRFNPKDIRDDLNGRWQYFNFIVYLNWNFLSVTLGWENFFFFFLHLIWPWLCKNMQSCFDSYPEIIEKEYFPEKLTFNFSTGKFSPRVFFFFEVLLIGRFEALRLKTKATCLIQRTVSLVGILLKIRLGHNGMTGFIFIRDIFFVYSLSCLSRTFSVNLLRFHGPWS